MNAKGYLKTIKAVESNLVGEEIKTTQNSIGSNIFIGFGKSLGGTLPDGRPRSARERELWVSDAAWRLTKDGRFIVGSGSYQSEIEIKIQELLKKKFISMRVTSQFLDVDFIFDFGYTLHTFFYLTEDNQWTMFFPKKMKISITF